MSKTRKVLLTLLALALVRRPVDMLLAAMLPHASVDPVPACVAGMVTTLLLLGVPAWLLRPWKSTRLTEVQPLWPWVLTAAAAALLMRGAMAPAEAAWQAWLGLSPDGLPVPGSVPAAMLYAAALAVIPALAEEGFFRGAVLTALLDGGRRGTAVLLTTAFFALMHGSLAALPGHLALSLLLTVMMLRTGRIAVPVTAHLVYNLSALPGMHLPLWGSLLCGAALLALTAGLLLRRTDYAQRPMRGLDGLIAAAGMLLLAAAYFV